MANKVNIIIPASNEAALIGPCLTALFASEGVGAARVIVVANGCSDTTAEVARGFADRATARGWELIVTELAQGHKPGALNAGDALAGPGARLYLDADVAVSPPLLQQICDILSPDTPLYASGIVQIPQPASWVSRAYARIYRQVPFLNTGVPGCGLFAVNAAGRARWGAFPDIIADDTFVRLHFAPQERLLAPAPYSWPVVEGWSALLRVRRRQNAGVREIAARYPALLANDDKPPFPKSHALKLALRDPLGFAIYATIGWLSRGGRGSAAGWSRGR